MSSSPLLALLDRADAHPATAAVRRRSYELLEPVIGAPIVDVGCGGGLAVAELTERGARVTGLDVDEQMLAAARTRLPGGDFRQGNAERLPFGDGELSGYRADKVLHMLPDPAVAVAEAARVLAPGGRIVLLANDWEGYLLDATDTGLTRRLVQARADGIPCPHASRRYRNLLLDAGFADVSLEVRTVVYTDDTVLPFVASLAGAGVAAGAATQADADDWLAEQEARIRANRFMLAMPTFLASARASDQPSG
jgi:SAM-dependent methyltransferase